MKIDKQKKLVTVDKAIKSFKTVICPSMCMLGKIENTAQCVKKADKCIADGACSIYRTFIKELEK